jgi:hypothetical protein
MLLLSRVFHLLQLQISEVWAKEKNAEKIKSFLSLLTSLRSLQNPNSFAVPGGSCSIFILLLYIRAKYPHVKDTMWILEKYCEVEPSLKGMREKKKRNKKEKRKKAEKNATRLQSLLC